MPSQNAVQWGSYNRWEGPVYRGRHKYAPPATPTWPEKLLTVISATEGCLDSVNMYDQAAPSVGALQWIENPHLFVSAMLGVVQEDAPAAFARLAAVMEKTGVTFGRNMAGLARFRRGQEWVTTPEHIRWLYLGGATGLKGQWSIAAREHAKAWCAALASVFEDPAAQAAQVAFTAPEIESYAVGDVRRYLWDGTSPSHEGKHGAVRALYLGYAANRPDYAARNIQTMQSRAPKWSDEWVRDVLRALVFGTPVAIYPDRYNRNRPVIERIFGVDWPDFAEELRALPQDGLGSPAAIQDRLRALGYDPGPTDNWWGRRTIAALTAFQKAAGLDPDGVIGPLTRRALAAAPPPAAA